MPRSDRACQFSASGKLRTTTEPRDPSSSGPVGVKVTSTLELAGKARLSELASSITG